MSESTRRHLGPGLTALLLMATAVTAGCTAWPPPPPPPPPSASSAPPPPAQQSAMVPTVSYSYGGDRELVDATRAASNYCGQQFRRAAMVQSISNLSDGRKAIVFDCQ